ncbi:MAG: U32 family peptidase [Dehalococcoidia bacterium]
MLLVPTTFEGQFLEGLKGYPVRFIYGSLTEEPGGRAKKWLPEVSLEQAGEHIASARAQGIGFIYTMNAPCTGNREFTAQGQRWLVERLGWLAEVGAEGIALANPYIIELVKRRFPELRVHVSTLARVDDVDKALFYQDLGADVIYLAEYVNRDFRLLKALPKLVRCELEVMVNLGCLVHCPMREYHAGFISHASECLDRSCYLDYCLAKCMQIKALRPAEVIKATWVRPEDVSKYQQMGIRHFKIAGREQGAAWILRAVAAYSAGRYEGALNDLVRLLDEVEPFGNFPIRVDNTRLNGFINFFETKDCRLGCLDCSYCGQWVEKALSVEGDREHYVNLIERSLKQYTSGSFRAPVARP